MKTTLLSAAVLMLFAAGAARAQQGDRPCKADAEKFCKDVKPGEGRIVDCLKAHEAELSADCKANGMGVKSRGGAKGQGAGGAMGPRGSEPCRADMEKFCKDAKPGERMNCMKEHEKDLSEACKARRAEGRKGNMKQNPCAADMQKFCKDVKPGEGRIMECMKAHEAEFSEGCKAETAKRREEMQKQNPCAADMEKFCKDVKPGEGRIIACMKAHEAELSEDCKARQGKGMGRMGKGGEGPRGGMGRGNPGDMPGNAPAPAGAPETSPEPGTK